MIKLALNKLEITGVQINPEVVAVAVNVRFMNIFDKHVFPIIFRKVLILDFFNLFYTPDEEESKECPKNWEQKKKGGGEESVSDLSRSLKCSPFKKVTARNRKCAESDNRVEEEQKKMR